MPRGDGTGPYGLGPFTGWGAGYCAGPGVFGGRMAGRRFGPRGFRWTVPDAWVRAEEASLPEDALRERAAVLKRQLKAIEERLSGAETDEE